jgi:methylmalonyl-CoA mutase cobalamin-binding domain/chain
VIGGGVIPDEDVESLKKMGVKAIFAQDTPPDVVVARVRELVAEEL